MDELELKEKRAKITKRLQELEERIYDIGTFHLTNEQTEAFKKERDDLLKEYRSLPNVSYVVADLTMKQSISLSDTIFNLKYRPDKDRWDFYDSNQYLSSDVKFDENGKSGKVTVPTRNSDTHGELVDYVYNFSVAPLFDEIAIKLSKIDKPKPCNKLAEGTATLKQAEDSYMEKQLGYVKDTTYNIWRKPTPQEYSLQLFNEKKAKDEKNKKKNKVSKTFFGGKFNLKR